jgi:hypothetical protein
MDEEILGGLKSALERGESLQKAMMTFFNAGYKREEIEEAARSLTKPVVETKPQMPVVPEKKSIISPEPSKKISVPEQVPQKISAYGQQIPAQQVSMPVPKASNYGQKSSKEKVMIIILISSLVFLICLLITIFLFKQQLIDFFSRFFS